MKKTFRPKMEEGIQSVLLDAICLGDWGLHETLGGCTQWTISHISTGFKLISINSCFSARNCLKEVSAQSYQWDGQGDTPPKFIDTFKPIALRYLGE